MEYILGIDFSCQPCEFTLSQVEGPHIEVIQQETCRLPIFTNKELLRSKDLATLLRTPTNDAKPTGDDPATEGDETPIEIASESLKELVSTTVEEIRTTLAAFNQGWTGITVIVPQHDHLSLNLELPFGDPRNLDRIVDLEVQDVVPFELDEFSVQYSSIGAVSSNLAEAPAASPNYDVHVGILPRPVVRNSLELCKAAGLEPNIITVPSSAIGAAYHLAKDFLKSNSAIVYNRGDEYSVAIAVNGEVRSERAVYASQIISALPAERKEERLQHVFTAIKLILTAVERRYNTQIEKVYLLGREVKGAHAQQLFGRPLEGISFQDLFKSSNSAVGLSPLGSLYAVDAAQLSPLSNFRAREFSFAPRIGEFIRALFGARRYAGIMAGAIVVALVVTYGARDFMLRSAHSALVEQVGRVIPNFSAEPGQVSGELKKSVTSLSAELGVFGSQAKFSPADAFLEVVKNLPSGNDFVITAIRVPGTTVEVTGKVGELSALGRFVNTLKAKSEMFTNVEYKNNRAADGFTFSITITLAQ